MQRGWGNSNVQQINSMPAQPGAQGNMNSAYPGPQQGCCCPEQQGGQQGCCDQSGGGCCGDSGQQQQQCCGGEQGGEDTLTSYIPLMLAVLLLMCAVAGIGAITGTYDQDDNLVELLGGGDSAELQMHLYDHIEPEDRVKELISYHAAALNVLKRQLATAPAPTPAPPTPLPPTPAPPTPAPPTPAPPTPAPPTPAPLTPAPPTPAPPTTAPATPAPPTPAPPTPAPPTLAPTPAPETNAPDTAAPCPPPVDCTCTPTDNDTTGTSERVAGVLADDDRTPLPDNYELTFDHKCNYSKDVLGSGGRICENFDASFMMYYIARAQTFRVLLYFLVALSASMWLFYYVFTRNWVADGAQADPVRIKELKAIMSICHGAVSVWAFFFIVTELYFYMKFNGFYRGQGGPKLQRFWKDFDNGFLTSVLLIALVICWPIVASLLHIVTWPIFWVVGSMCQPNAVGQVSGMGGGGTAMGGAQGDDCCSSFVQDMAQMPTSSIWEFLSRSDDDRQVTAVSQFGGQRTNVNAVKPAVNPLDEDEEMQGPPKQVMGDGHTLLPTAGANNRVTPGAHGQNLTNSPAPSTLPGANLREASSDGLGALSKPQQNPTAHYPSPAAPIGTQALPPRKTLDDEFGVHPTISDISPSAHKPQGALKAAKALESESESEVEDRRDDDKKEHKEHKEKKEKKDKKESDGRDSRRRRRSESKDDSKEKSRRRRRDSDREETDGEKDDKKESRRRRRSESRGDGDDGGDKSRRRRSKSREHKEPKEHKEHKEKKEKKEHKDKKEKKDKKD